MSEYSIKLVQNAGVDTDTLVKLLISNAASELSTYYHYGILQANLNGLEGAWLKEIVETAKIEDRIHYEALVVRIYELGGTLPETLHDFYNQASCPPAFLPCDKTDIKETVRVLRDAERCAMAGYQKICKMTFDKDYRTYDLALAILHEETEHECQFSEILGESADLRAVRKGAPSPFVSRFLR